MDIMDELYNATYLVMDEKALRADAATRRIATLDGCFFDSMAEALQHMSGGQTNPAGGWTPRVEAAYKSLGIDPKYYEADKKQFSMMTESRALEMVEAMRKYADFEPMPIGEARQVHVGDHEDYRDWIAGWTAQLENWIDTSDQQDPAVLDQAKMAYFFLQELVQTESQTPALTDEDFEFLGDVPGKNPTGSMQESLTISFFNSIGAGADATPDEIMEKMFASENGAADFVQKLYATRFDIGFSGDQYVSGTGHSYPGKEMRLFNADTGEPMITSSPAYMCAFSDIYLGGKVAGSLARNYDGYPAAYGQVDADKVPDDFVTNEKKLREMYDALNHFPFKDDPVGKKFTRLMTDYFKDIYRVSEEKQTYQEILDDLMKRLNSGA